MVQKKYGQFGASPILLVTIVLFIALIGALGYILYSKTKSEPVSNKASTVSKPNPNPTEDTQKTLSDEEGVMLAVCPDTNSVTRTELSKEVELDGSYAYYAGGCDVGSPTGATYFIQKKEGRWLVIESGSGDIDCEKLTSAGFPESILSKCSGPEFIPS